MKQPASPAERIEKELDRMEEIFREIRRLAHELKEGDDDDE